MLRKRRIPSVRPRWVLLGLAGMAAVWAFLAYRQLDEARGAAESGLDRVEESKAEVTADELLSGRGLDGLDAAREDFRRAAAAADSPLLWPARWLPVAGRQVESVRAMTRSAAEVVDAGLAAIDAARATVAGNREGGPARVEVARDVEGIAAELRRRIDGVDLGPSEALVGPLRNARDRFERELGDARDGVRRLDDAATGSAAFLEGPSTYLVLAANNGEMRAGSGMLLSAGVLTVGDGEFSMGPMSPTQELRVPEGAVAIADPDLAARWGWAYPNIEWRNLAMTPRFDATAELAAAMWKARTGQAVDGVLALDPFALQALLAVTGPVEVEGETISADNVIQIVLIDQYADVDYEDLPADQAARRERLSVIARAALDALDRGGYDAADLVESLGGAADGRHLLAWSGEAVEQRGWEAAGIGGRLDEQSLMVSVLSQGGNKLDQFLAVDASLDVARGPGATEATLTVTIANDAPTDLPRYVAGPSVVPGEPGRGVSEGVYAGIVSVNLPGAARDSGIGGGVPLLAAGADGPTRVVATRVQLTRGEQRTLTVTFELPEWVTRVRVEPSARTPEQRWSFEGRSFTDAAQHTLVW